MSNGGRALRVRREPARRTGIPASKGYRPDVDGLRAVAVIAVVLFHFDVPGFEGGFVGVDVFFVISGYLITRQLRLAIDQGTFTFREFYSRRARRLLPAAAATILATLLAGAVLLPPLALQDTARSAVAAGLSVSNLWFAQNTGYWAAEAHDMPLLHTWSLGVEEQFYLVWPLLFLILITKARGRAPLAIALLTLVSIVATGLLTQIAPTKAFYLTPARAYEFGFGALCVWAESERWRPRFVARVLMFLAGLVAIGYAVATFDAATVFPGFAAIMPAAGTALVIISRRPTHVERILSNAPMVAIGLRSYSLYLVHWPILVLALTRVDQLTWFVVGGLTALCIGLTELQFRWVERRFRLTTAGGPDRSHRRSLRRATPALGGALAVTVVAAAIVTSNGLPFRYDEGVRSLATTPIQQINAAREAASRELCADQSTVVCGVVEPSRTNAIVLGDSHATDGLNVLAAMNPEINVLLAGRGGCPPFRNLNIVSEVARECAAYNPQRFAAVEELAGAVEWAVISTHLTEDRLAQTQELVSWLRGLGYRVAVLGVGLRYHDPIRDVVVIYGQEASDRVSDALRARGVFDLDARYRAVVDDLGGLYLSKLAVTCPRLACELRTPGSNQLIVFDRHHLTFEGSRWLGAELRNASSSIFATRSPMRSLAPS